jgi:hypothetical protein
MTRLLAPTSYAQVIYLTALAARSVVTRVAGRCRRASKPG